MKARNMWVVIKSDGDADYATVYGLFGSEQEANDACLDDDGDYVYRAVKLKDVTEIS